MVGISHGRRPLLDANAVVILEVFVKVTRATPKSVIEACRERLRRYDKTLAENP